jgi:hypothetical protein
MDFAYCFLLLLVCLFRQTKWRHFYHLFLGKSFKCLLNKGIWFLFVELFVVAVNFVHVLLNKLVLTVVLQIVTVVLRVLLSALGRVDELAHRFQV